MKPTVQISRPSRRSETARRSAPIRNRPITDWNFQATAPDLRDGAAPVHPGARHAGRQPGFHTLSQEFFQAEEERQSRVEGALFGLMVTLTAWPIALAGQAAWALLK